MHVDVGRRHLTGGNGADGRGRAGDAVAAGEQVVHIAHLTGKTCHEHAPLDGHAGLLKALDLDALSDGHHDDVRRNTDLRQIGLVGPGPPGLVGLADDLGLYPQRGGAAVLVGLDADGRHQRLDLRALGQRAGDLVGQRRHILDAAAVDARHLLRTQTDGAAGHVHGHVAAADDHHLLAGKVRHHVVADGAQHLHGGHHVLAVLAGDAHLLILMGADGDIQAVVVLLQLLHPDIGTHGGVGMGLNAQRQDGVDLRVQQVPGEPVAGDAVAQHAAQLCPLLVHRDLVAHQRQIVGAAQAAGAAADDGHLFAGGRRAGGLGHVPGVVHGVPLQTPDVDGVVDHVPAAPGLAGMLADIGAGGGEGVVLADQAHGVGAASLAHQRHVARHVHAGGAQRHAGHGQLQTGQTSMVLDVLLVVVPEALQTVQHKPCRVPADGAVGGVHDGAGGLLDNGDGAHVGGAVQHRVDELAQLPQTDAAGHALAAGLGVAQLQKRQRHIHGT